MNSYLSKIFIKTFGFRIIAISFTSFFVPIQTSIILNIGLFLLYYFYDLLWGLKSYKK